MKTKRKRKAKPAKKVAAPKTVLVLRTCRADMTSTNAFKYPASGPVEAPDWKPTQECGNGLHGWKWGAGNWRLKCEGENIKWLVIEVAESDLIDLDSKVKFPRGNVVGCYGHWREAMAFIRAKLLLNATMEAIATKEGEVASAIGYSGHASATGYYGHAIATGYSGHASATGDSGHAIATGDSGHASATGYSGHAIATGDSGHAIATGDSGHAIATGYSGHAIATGYYGHASATGDYGHASATGDYGWAVTGYGGKAKAEKNGTLTILWRDGAAKRDRVAVGYVGEDGIEENTWYRVENGKLVKAE